MKRIIISKKPFQHSIRSESLFCNDILKISSPDHETVRLSWEISDAVLSAAEAVLFESIKDVEKQILLFCVKTESAAYGRSIPMHLKGKPRFFPLQAMRSTKRNTGYTIRSTCRWPFSPPAASTLGKTESIQTAAVFCITTISRIGRLNFPRTRVIL